MRTQMQVNKGKDVQIEKDKKCSRCGCTLVKKSAVYKVVKHYLCGTCARSKPSYARGETVFIPGYGDKVAPVLARLNYQSIWSRGGGIASVVSTGKAAINQSCFQEGVVNENTN